MMINKRLIGMAGQSKKYILLNILCQWIGLAANVLFIFSVANLFGHLYAGDFDDSIIGATLLICAVCVIVRFLTVVLASKMSHNASMNIKKVLREKMYQKLLRLGISYNRHISTAEAVQLSGEGVEQLEIYFGKYLPQFFYSLLAPVTLFAVLTFVSLKTAVILLVCVPLIPMSIVMVQKFAKKLLKKYWGEYTTLGDNFLENVQGLTTLKIYRADGHKNRAMNAQAERFRTITMKVLTMQLNSVTLMDLVAYGGSALGVVTAVSQLAAGTVSLAGCVAIILLAADFFIPLRLLGSYFHIAMNGMAASEKMFALLDVPETAEKTAKISGTRICIENFSFSYDQTREILHNITMDIPPGSLTAIAGESGSGKSTIASLLMGIHQGYSGSVTVGGAELSAIREESIMSRFVLVGHKSYLFGGTVRENLQMGNPAASDAQMRAVLEQVMLWDFLQSGQGLNTVIDSEGANFSGGQRQRLAIARALLHNGEVYIFDEATSNIDVESENDIMTLIHRMRIKKTVILISHRLANLAGADNIYVLENGRLTESGRHDALVQKNGSYAAMWHAQQKLESIREVTV